MQQSPVPANTPNIAPRKEDLARARVSTRLVEEVERFPDLNLADLDTAGLTDRDAAFAHAIYDAAIRHWITIEYLVLSRMDKPDRPLDTEVVAALLAGAAQIFYLDRVPAHAAIDEAVEWIKRAGKPKAAGIVNAVLRRMAELKAGPDGLGTYRAAWTGGRDELPLPAAPGQGDRRVLVLRRPILPGDATERLAIATGHPLPLVKGWVGRYGRDVATRIALHAVAKPPTVLNTAYATAIPEQLVPCKAPGHHALVESRDVGEILRGRDDLWVQDAASSRAVSTAARLVPAGAIRTIADVCAGQGTKTKQLAAAFPDASVLATDADPKRMATLRETFKNHPRVKVVELHQLEASCPAGVDLVVLDVPCSNTGTIARRPEARFRTQTDQIARLGPIQDAILKRGIALANPGGYVLYSTCSIEPAENEARSGAAAEAGGLRLVKEELALPEGVPGDGPEAFQDGGYWALLHKAP